MIYAPVIIPTLNRYDHFKQCLESLERCTGADKTEVYIGLDYPPSEKYVEGWKRIDAYLAEKEESNGFKVLHVIRRERNYGVLTEHSNISDLCKNIMAHYDRYILSEDDNVFSPNFLEYINKGLELFKDDPTVLAINGYCHPYNFKFDDNNYFRHNVDFSAWGYGIWSKKIKSCEYDIIENRAFRNHRSVKYHYRIIKQGLLRYKGYLYLAYFNKEKYIACTDNVLSNYMGLMKMDVIMPKESKVRNIGWDETGNSFVKGLTDREKRIAHIQQTQQIDKNSQFEYIGDGWNFYNQNNRTAVRECEFRLSVIEFIIKGYRKFINRIFKNK